MTFEGGIHCGMRGRGRRGFDIRISMVAMALAFGVSFGPALGRAEIVATPLFGMPGGAYATGFDLQVTCGTPGATVRYTVNGQDPILIDPEIGEDETLLVSGSVTLKARAWKEGMEPSAVAAVDYRITGELAAGESHALGLQNGGAMLSWGRNDMGQLGRDAGVLGAPCLVPGFTNGIGIAAGQKHSLVLRDDGTVWAWGENAHGQLGDNTLSAKAAPVQVVGLTGVAQIAAGQDFSVALMDDGTVRAWGDNSWGQLGDGTTNNSRAPLPVPDIHNASGIAAGRAHALVLLEDGTVGAMGRNIWGQLGDGTTNDRWGPVAVIGLSNVVQIAAGGYFSMALDASGQLFCWGSGVGGALGLGDAGNRLAPAAVAGMTNIVALAGTMGQFGYAIDAIGRLWGWGENARWQLGDGTTANRLSPEVIPLADAAVRAVGGYYNGYAALADGSLWAWGEGDYGEIGDGASDDRMRPVLVPDLALSPGMDRRGPIFLQASNGNHLVTMEAEHFYTNIARGGHAWVSGTNNAGYSADGHMAALPNLGTTWSAGEFEENAPRMDFKIRFATTGIHYIWVRGLAPSSADGSLHAGLDGMPVASADKIDGFTTAWRWSRHTRDSSPACVNITAAGVHDLNLWMRQDGFVIDKIALTHDPDYSPSGTGPGESEREARLYPLVNLTAPTNGSVFMVGDNVACAAGATAEFSAIAKMEFFQGTHRIAEDQSAPYEVTWTNPPAGEHLLSVRATDAAGMSRTAGPVSITVRHPDTDGDGLHDADEEALGTDPNDADTDDDGLDDGSEIHVTQTNPLNADSDGDRVPDGQDDDPLHHVPGTGSGLTVRWFSGPAFGTLHSMTNGQTIDYDWGWSNGPTGDDRFCAAWTGLIEPRYTEIYAFIAHSDDGIRVWIDDRLVIDRWWGSYGDIGTISLEANHRYSIRVHYRETGGAAKVRLEWRSASQPQEVLPISRLYPETDADRDGLADGWELNQYGSLTSAGGLGDPDEDGLSNEEEFLRLTDFRDSDSDDDGLNDGEEVNSVGSNPLQKDTDYDGLPDKWEGDHGYSPIDAEDMGADADGDGLRLAQEEWLGTDPNDPASGPCANGVLRREIWNGVQGLGVISLTGNADFPSRPSSVTFHCALACPTDRGDNYGSRVRGYIVPPETGTYQFWVTGDDETQLWLSTSASKFEKRRLAMMAGATRLDEFNRYETQCSGPVPLIQGTEYYFEVLQKEAYGGDALCVFWSMDGGRREIVPSSALRPYKVGAAETGDTDDDDLPDAWEQQYFGDLSQDIQGDIDSDGLTNEQEYRLGSNVNDPDAEAFGGTARWERWSGIWDEIIPSLKDDGRYPNQPTAAGYAERLETPAWFGNYTGHRLRGWLQAPLSGPYTFWISGGGEAELALSTDASPENAMPIAQVPPYSNYPDFHQFDWLQEQKSNPVSLAAGQWYYFDVHYVNYNGRDHVAVAWLPPSQTRREVIPGSYLRAHFTDADGDSMDDAWEDRIVEADLNDGICSIQDVLAGDDFDGDRFPNIYEWARHSDPTSPASIPREIMRVDADGSADFETIQGALDAAVASYPIISVASGIYAGGIVLTNGPALLLGELSPGVEPPTVEGIAGGTGAIVRIGSDSTIDGFVITRATGARGSGIHVFTNAAPRLLNLIVRENIAEDGAGLYNDGGKPSIIHCTFARNAAAGSGHGNGLCSTGGSITVLNSILWDAEGGAPEEIYIAGGSVSCSHSIVCGGQYGGINADPLLTRWGYLTADAAAIGAGIRMFAPALDIHGETRDRLNSPDLGADEFHDADGDGLPDWWEALYGGYADDGDGLSAASEYLYGTHPGLSDTDGDGMPDDWEAAHGLEPTNDGSADPRHGPAGDPDGDGAPNAEDADPDDGASGRLEVTITAPDDGSVQ